jgi:hypothetical protein
LQSQEPKLIAVVADGFAIVASALRCATERTTFTFEQPNPAGSSCKVPIKSTPNFNVSALTLAAHELGKLVRERGTRSREQGFREWGAGISYPNFSDFLLS